MVDDIHGKLRTDQEINSNTEVGLTPMQRWALGYIEGADWARRRKSRSVPPVCPPSEMDALISAVPSNSNHGVLPRDINWTFIAAVPVVKFAAVHAADFWISWFQEVNSQELADGGRGYGHLVAEDISKPVIFLDDDGAIDILSGRKRIAASFVKGAKSIPAIVGRTISAAAAKPHQTTAWPKSTAPEQVTA